MSPSGSDVTLDPAAGNYFADPYAHYARQRTDNPIYRHQKGMWYVFRHADALKVVRDPSLSNREVFAMETERNRLMVDTLGEDFVHRRSMSKADAPDHTRMRRLLSRPFTPRGVERWRERVQERVEALIGAAGGPTIELMTQVARPLAYAVTCEMLGVPAGDEQLLVDSSHATTLAIMEPDPTPAQLVAAKESAALLHESLAEYVTWKRSHPGDDLLTGLLDAEHEGVLSPLEVTSQVSQLFKAGHQTTVSVIGLAVIALMRNRDQWERLCQGPDLLPNAVEELLRYDNTIQLIRRMTPAPFEVGGTTIPAGTHVIAWIGSANRDPDKWGPDADRLDISRDNARDHLSFGGGPHLCLGAWLARVELQEVLRTLTTSFPEMEPESNDYEWERLMSMRGPQSVVVQTHA